MPMNLGSHSYSYWDLEIPIQNPRDAGLYDYVSRTSAYSILDAIVRCKQAQYRLFKETNRRYPFVIKWGNGEETDCTHSDDQLLELILRFC